jgi:transcriptional regulator with XRE-family HTH domain
MRTKSAKRTDARRARAVFLGLSGTRQERTMSQADVNQPVPDAASAPAAGKRIDGAGTRSPTAKCSDFAHAIQPLHRLATVRRQQGLSQRAVARRLGVNIAAVGEQEHEATDLPLSLIYAWQKALDVPAADLLVDSKAPFSPTVLNRARLVKLMKTAASIRERSHGSGLEKLVATLVDDLLEIMPELREVVGWNIVGQRRTLDEPGQVIERQVPDDFFKRRIR